MKKSILNIEGIQVLNKKQQTKIKAGSYNYCSGGVGSLLGAIINWIYSCEEE